MRISDWSSDVCSSDLPMLGHRGCRLGVTYPEIYEMQARAIFEAACDVAAETGAAPIPEVMIPLVATRREFDLMKEVVDRSEERRVGKECVSTCRSRW